MWTHLEHLNKRNRQVEIREIAADQRKGKHESYGDDFAEVDVAVHGDFFAGVKEGGEAGEELGC